MATWKGSGRSRDETPGVGRQEDRPGVRSNLSLHAWSHHGEVGQEYTVGNSMLGEDGSQCGGEREESSEEQEKLWE